MRKKPILLVLATFVLIAMLLSIGALKTVQAQTGDTILIDVKGSTLSDHSCDNTEWHFVINQVESESLAPDSIHVTWANGASEDVGRSKFTGGTAHYSTTSNLESTVTGASAYIYAAWKDGGGQFNLSHGPCTDPTPTDPTPTDPTPTDPTPTDPTPTDPTPTDPTPTDPTPTDPTPTTPVPTTPVPTTPVPTEADPALGGEVPTSPLVSLAALVTVLAGFLFAMWKKLTKPGRI